MSALYNTQATNALNMHESYVDQIPAKTCNRIRSIFTKYWKIKYFVVLNIPVLRRIDIFVPTFFVTRKIQTFIKFYLVKSTNIKNVSILLTRLFVLRMVNTPFLNTKLHSWICGSGLVVSVERTSVYIHTYLLQFNKSWKNKTFRLLPVSTDLSVSNL